MDIQLKKGLSDVLVLAVVKQGHTYGYKLLQDVRHIMDVSESTLYPVLRRLEAQGLLDTYQQEFNGRLRKYYMITSLGRHRLEEYKVFCADLKGIIDFIMES